MRFPDQLISCVGFFSYDQQPIQYRGTGFLAAIKGEHGNVYLHLVTAAHVAEKIENRSWVFGVNLKSGGKVLIKSGNIKWWYHPTDKDHVDAAVTAFATDQVSDYELSWIPETAFATDQIIKERGIGVGDQVNVVGLFTRFHGNERHIPIVRTGNIAMMPRESIPTKKYGPMEAYLAEGRSIGGLSGSPVFGRGSVTVSGEAPDGSTKHWFAYGPFNFLGLMHGHWEVDVQKDEQAEAVNMGISIIVPAKKILEILYHPELVDMRKKFDDAIANNREPILDSDFDETTLRQEDFESALKQVTRKVK